MSSNEGIIRQVGFCPQPPAISQQLNRRQTVSSGVGRFNLHQIIGADSAVLHWFGWTGATSSAWVATEGAKHDVTLAHGSVARKPSDWPPRPSQLAASICKSPAICGQSFWPNCWRSSCPAEVICEPNLGYPSKWSLYIFIDMHKWVYSFIYILYIFLLPNSFIHN